LHNFLQAIDLPAAPTLDRSRIKPPDPDEDVDGAHKVPGGKCRFSRSGDTIGKWNAILPAHPIGELIIRCGTRLDDIATPGELDVFRERSSNRRVGPSRNYGIERTSAKSPSSVTRTEVSGSTGSVRSFVLDGGKWRAIQNKTTNLIYIIDITL
jgi:hypothetical protein